MFIQVWKKYLSVIAILLKRSATGVQTLEMNHTDFERAAGGRKIKFSFSSLLLDNGRVSVGAKHSAIAKDLAAVLQGSELTVKLIRKQNLEFSLNDKFQLIIRNNTPPPQPEQEAMADDEKEKDITIGGEPTEEKEIS